MGLPIFAAVTGPFTPGTGTTLILLTGRLVTAWPVGEVDIAVAVALKTAQRDSPALRTRSRSAGLVQAATTEEMTFFIAMRLASRSLKPDGFVTACC